jgi:hypothetical protein
MPIHFAASRPAYDPLSGTRLRRRVAGHAANDNDDRSISSDTMLRAALQHFTRYGLGTAEDASQRAEQAFAAGNYEGYQRWLGICRTFDRRLAASVARRTEGTTG